MENNPKQHFQRFVEAGSPVGEVIAVNSFLVQARGLQPRAARAQRPQVGIRRAEGDAEEGSPADALRRGCARPGFQMRVCRR